MNNNLFPWQIEMMVRYEMQEMERAVEQERLVRQAGFSYRDMLVRAANSLFNLLKTRRAGAQEKSTGEKKGSIAIEEH